MTNIKKTHLLGFISNNKTYTHTQKKKNSTLTYYYFCALCHDTLTHKIHNIMSSTAVYIYFLKNTDIGNFYYTVCHYKLAH